MSVNSILNSPLTRELKRKSTIRYFVISDIHLGCKRVPVKKMVDNLSTVFGNFEEGHAFTKLDIVFIAGDLFDQALWFSNEDVMHILLWLRKLMWWCRHHGVMLRVLEGTPSHDRKQPRNLVPLAKSFPGIDFKYIETMCVESFGNLGLTCLYVPDEFGGSAEAAQKLIQEELNRLQLDKVDIAIMHGMCRYQVPEIASNRYKYDEQFILRITRFFTNIGHVHIPSTYDRILCQGSFDCISHGEEGPKGGILVELSEESGNKFYPVINQGACKFVTCHVRWKDIDKAVAQVRKMASELPYESHLRIKAAKGHPILNVFDQLAREYNGLIFTKITEEEESERQQLLDQQDLLSVDYTPIHIHKENIVGMILKEIKGKYDFHPNLLDQLEAKLEELK